MGLIAFFTRNIRISAFIFIITGAIAVVVNVIYVYLPNSPVEHSLRTECALAPLFLSAGYFLLKDENDMLRRTRCAPLVTLCLGIFAYTSFSPWWFIYFAPFFFAHSINNIEISSMLRKVLEVKMVRIVGVWSFSIYIWQQPFYNNKEVLLGSLSVVPVMMLSIMSYYFFEQPVRCFLNSNWGRLEGNIIDDILVRTRKGNG